MDEDEFLQEMAGASKEEMMAVIDAMAEQAGGHEELADQFRQKVLENEPIEVSFVTSESELARAGVPYHRLEELIQGNVISHCSECEGVSIVPKGSPFCPSCGHGVHVSFAVAEGSAQDLAEEIRQQHPEYSAGVE